LTRAIDEDPCWKRLGAAGEAPEACGSMRQVPATMGTRSRKPGDERIADLRSFVEKDPKMEVWLARAR
jgi:hypothetical protein